MQTEIAIGPEARDPRRFVRKAILPILLRYLMLFILLLFAFHLYVNVSKAVLEQGVFIGHFDLPPDFALQEHDLNWEFGDLLPF